MLKATTSLDASILPTVADGVILPTANEPENILTPVAPLAFISTLYEGELWPKAVFPPLI